MEKWIHLIIGGVLGTSARYAVTGAIHHAFGTKFPLGTLVVNLAGCFIVGFLAAGAGVKFNLSQEARILLVTGFCGAFTTFSALILETDHLFREGNVMPAVLNVAVSVAAGLVIFRLGMLLGEAI